MKALRHIQSKPELQALILVGAAAVAYSLLPLSVDILASSRSPLTVGAGIHCGYLLFTVLLRSRKRGDPALSFSSLWHRLKSTQTSRFHISLLALASMANVLGYVVYVMSASYVDTAVTASVYELWPIVWFICMVFVDRHRNQQWIPTRIPATTQALLILAAFAVVPLVYSMHAPDTPGLLSGIHWLGSGLAVLAPVLGGIGALNLLIVDRISYGPQKTGENDWKIIKQMRWELEAGIIDKNTYDIRLRDAGESIILAAQIATRITMLPIVVTIAAAERGGMSSIISWEALGGLAIGLLLVGPAGIWLRRSHLISARREIVALQHFVPALSLIWLMVFRGIEVPRIDLLVFGTVAIIVINVLIHITSNSRHHKAI